jgi:hypothetical protein
MVDGVYKDFQRWVWLGEKAGRGLMATVPFLVSARIN